MTRHETLLKLVYEATSSYELLAIGRKYARVIYRDYDVVMAWYKKGYELLNNERHAGN